MTAAMLLQRLGMWDPILQLRVCLPLDTATKHRPRRVLEGDP